MGEKSVTTYNLDDVKAIVDKYDVEKLRRLAKVLDINVSSVKILLYLAITKKKLMYDDLINLTNLSQATISRCVRELHVNGYVTIVKLLKGLPGHPKLLVYISKPNAKTIMNRLSEIEKDILHLREYFDW